MNLKLFKELDFCIDNTYHEEIVIWNMLSLFKLCIAD